MAGLEIATRGMFTRNLVLDEDGILRGKTRLPWTAVDHYRFVLPDWRRRGDFLLFAASGKVLLALEPIFDHWPLVAELVFEQLHPRLRADEPYYHPFAFAGDTLTHPGCAALPLADVDHIELAALGRAVAVVVHARGGREWVQADIGDVANLWLWIEALLARGVAVRSELDFHLPPPLFPIVAALSAASRLPAAKLVT